MKNKKIFLILITSIFTILPILIGFLIWDKLPDKIPVHFDINGIPDRYDNKLKAIIEGPLIFLLLHLFTIFAINKTPKNNNIGSKMKILSYLFAPVMSISMAILTYLFITGFNFNITNLIMLLVSIIIIIIGNYLPKCKQNYVVGIKLPWTLDDEENWYKTHRFAGKIYVFIGVVSLLANLFFKNNSIFIILVLLSTFIIIFYSYINRKEH